MNVRGRCHVAPSTLLVRQNAGRDATRRVLLGWIAFGIFAAPFAAFPQSAGKVPRIGYLRDETPPSTDIEAFRQGLREYGYVEGRNIIVEYRWADGDAGKLHSAVRDLIRLNVDLIVTSAPPATQAAKAATTTVPIVMVLVADPVAFKFVDNLRRSGGNITGFAFLHPELSGKRLELLRETFPKLSNVAVMWNAANPYKALDLKEVQRVAAALKVTVQAFPLQTAEALAGAFERAVEKGADGLITLEDPFTIAHHARIAALAAKHRLPAVYGAEPFVNVGGFMFYGPDRADQNRRAAGYIDRILKGAKPADLPVEQPTKFDMAINMKTARMLGIAIPQSILVRADKVIE